MFDEKYFTKESKQIIFKYGRNDYKKAEEKGTRCKDFILDADEDELVTSTKFNTCYNCLFRRWSKTSFTCLKQN